MRLDGRVPTDVARAAQVLADGGLLAFPTETVYGLGARADDATAVAGIFRLKGRPANHPLIVHVAGAAGVAAFADAVPAFATRLMEAFWPGPLTLILPRRPEVAAAAAGHQPTIGLRAPAHPVARALLEATERLGVPGVAAPSANRFGRVSATLPTHVEVEFGTALALLDGDAAPIGIESTIVDCSRGRPVLLRPGSLARTELAMAAGLPMEAPDAAAPQVSGSLRSHYAPDAKVRLMDAATLSTALRMLGEGGRGVAVYSRSPPPSAAGAVRFRRMGTSAASVAYELYAVLREFDAEGAAVIWIEAPPPEPEWDGVRDRLARAAA